MLLAAEMGSGGAHTSEWRRVTIFAAGRALLAVSSRMSVVFTFFSHPTRTKGCQGQCFVAKHWKPTIVISWKFLNTSLKHLKEAPLRLHGLKAQPRGSPFRSRTGPRVKLETTIHCTPGLTGLSVRRNAAGGSFPLHQCPPSDKPLSGPHGAK